MVGAVAGLHLIVETTHLRTLLAEVYFVPEALFAVPLIYAALNFGFLGTLATAIWAILLSAYNFLYLEGDGERLGSVLQMTLIAGVALLVGSRVDRETAARRLAERSEAALKASEAKYRSLFTTSGVPVLVADLTGTVQDVNPAAARLFSDTVTQTGNLKLEDLIGTDAARKVLRMAEEPSSVGVDTGLNPRPGIHMDVRIVSSPFTDPYGQRFLQVVVQDVTGERRRQRSLQSFAAHILQAQEEERKRIARELHDEAIQSLILLCRELDSLASKPLEHIPGPGEGLQRVRRLAEEVVEELRQFTRRLRPSTLEDLGLAACLRRLALELEERTGIAAAVSVQGYGERLPLNLELALFRIAQEALHNVERHSSATHCSIELRRTADAVRLTVADNGRGFNFDPASLTADPEGHLGLIGMGERARAIGGKLRIRSSPGRGTSVAVSVPVGRAPGPMAGLAG